MRTRRALFAQLIDEQSQLQYHFEKVTKETEKQVEKSLFEIEKLQKIMKKEQEKFEKLEKKLGHKTEKQKHLIKQVGHIPTPKKTSRG